MVECRLPHAYLSVLIGGILITGRHDVIAKCFVEFPTRAKQSAVAGKVHESPQLLQVVLSGRRPIMHAAVRVRMQAPSGTASRSLEQPL